MSTVMSRAELEARVAELSPQVESLWADVKAADNALSAKRRDWNDAYLALKALKDELTIAKAVEERLAEAGVTA